jgi:hypothetical protein
MSKSKLPTQRRAQQTSKQKKTQNKLYALHDTIVALAFQMVVTR